MLIGKLGILHYYFDSFKRMKKMADEKMIFYDTESKEFVRVGKASRWSGNGGI